MISVIEMSASRASSGPRPRTSSSTSRMMRRRSSEVSGVEDSSMIELSS